MKTLHVIPPVAALLVSGVWIGLQRQSMNSLRHETAVLTGRIDAAMAAAAVGTQPASRNGSARKPATDLENMTWQELSAAIAEAGNHATPGLRFMAALHRRLLAMSPEELLAALDEIEALEPPADAKLIEAFLDVLGEKAPKALLDRYAEKLSAPMAGALRQRLANAFQGMAAKDLAAAEAWLDRQIAAGHFVSRALSGKHSARSNFEGSLISVMVGSDPAGAARRLRGMPEAQRAVAIAMGIPYPLDDAQATTLLRMTSESVPPDQRSLPVDFVATQLLAAGGLERVERALAHLDDPQRSAQLAAHAARQQFRSSNNAETLGAMREWLGTHAPAEVDRFTGEALGGFDGQSLQFDPDTGRTLDDSGGRTFGQASELALKYHAESRSDEVLAAFLRGQMARHNLPEARELLPHIHDEALREDLREELE